ncbi:MAG: TraR/DksA C4-type zinc finger protein [Desulfuromonadales bacterium]|nr:TraR/DksA C4-type zinc finger protein [Desulfuromonadales bacterium]
MEKTKKRKILDLEFYQDLLLKRFSAIRQQKDSPIVKSEEECIELALSRIRWGNYKRCMECGADIGDDRLMADPTILVCQNCSTAKMK